MWIADQWKDYQVLDTSKGEKLERWGDYLLVRPEPTGYLGYPEEESGLEKDELATTTAARRAAVNGNSSTCRNSGPFSTKTLRST